MNFFSSYFHHQPTLFEKLTSYEAIFTILLLLSALLFTLFLYRLGVFTKPKCTTTTLPGFNFLYVEHVGPYQRLSSIYKKLREETAGKINIKGTIGISYDDPVSMEPSRLRSVVGVALSEKGQPSANSVANFIAAHPEYTQTYIQESQLLQTEIPVVNSFSYFMVTFKLMPALFKHMETNKISLEGGLLQISGMPESKIILGTPVSNTQQFNLSKAPQPENKNKKNE